MYSMEPPSDMIPLYKVPLLILTAASFRISCSPPNPPPEKKEIMDRGDLTGRATAQRTLLQFVVLSVLLFEALTIISYDISNSPWREISKILLPNGDPALLRPSSTFYVGVFLVVAGACIRYACYEYLGRLFTFELSLRDDHHLVTSGPYSIVRHPSYTGFCLGLVGLYAVVFGEGSYVRAGDILQTYLGTVVFCIMTFIWVNLSYYFIKRTEAEDEFLKDRFGKEWEEWEKRVKWKLIPGLY
ncbi:hypothetical protein VKT23_007517 [Stygiomarasmius scandens]|uniref:Protein-S-isoprenylcysteine O-methyltransferase n=1 Tax=Marasmiellus scandens TaxID=2682957 RepID=A0ABR1JL20_9AGAR